MESLLRTARKLIPKKLFALLQPSYHLALAFISALVYRFPSRHIKVVGITGTKGKTSTAELASRILEAGGYKTALAGTLRFKIGNQEEPNLFKMTMPGRFFVQRFIRKAVRAKCDWVVLEMTSEGAKQSRHRFIELDALIFTNLSPEHIESHGSYENYVAAKLLLAKALERSSKHARSIIVNDDDKEGKRFLSVNVPRKFPYHLRDVGYTLTDDGTELAFHGEKITSPLRGIFNIYNIMAAATFGISQNISPQHIKKGVESVKVIRGRAEKIDAGQPFSVFVDYAHTPDSLRALYEAFEGKKKICVLGNTGGGRDTWKRPAMGALAEQFCAHVILTNEDPYDEDPNRIIEDVAGGMKQKPRIIFDRREAIHTALTLAETGDVVLITGKGTDPYIMEANGKKTPWSDARVTREELGKLTQKN